MNKKYLYAGMGIVIVVTGAVFLFLNTSSSSIDTTNSNILTRVNGITHSHGLAVDAFELNKVYIATHHGLFVLIDDTDLYQIGKSKDDYMGFSADPTRQNTFFSSGHPSYGGNIGFQKSENGGLTWEKISNGIDGPVDFHAMAVSPINPNYIWGWYQGKIQHSIDGGVNWKIVNDTVLVVGLVADLKDVNTVYGASPTGQGILVSRDGGVNWTSLSPDLVSGQVSAIAINPTNANTMLVYSEKLGGLTRSIDKGVTWKKLPITFDGTILYIAFSPKDSLIAYALTHTNSLYKSIDGGETWQQIVIGKS